MRKDGERNGRGKGGGGGEAGLRVERGMVEKGERRVRRRRRHKEEGLWIGMYKVLVDI